jgi:hypothetical protein
MDIFQLKRWHYYLSNGPMYHNTQYGKISVLTKQL